MQGENNLQGLRGVEGLPSLLGSLYLLNALWCGGFGGCCVFEDTINRVETGAHLLAQERVKSSQGVHRSFIATGGSGAGAEELQEGAGGVHPRRSGSTGGAQEQGAGGGAQERREKRQKFGGGCSP